MPVPLKNFRIQSQSNTQTHIPRYHCLKGYLNALSPIKTILEMNVKDIDSFPYYIYITNP